MGVGRNPYFAKAEAARQKANNASDGEVRVLAFREAAHERDRAAAREPPGKCRVEYEGNATRVRALTD